MSDIQPAVDTEPEAPPMEPVEPKSERLRRHRRRTRLYVIAVAVVVLLVIVIAFAVDNAHNVKLSWVFGTSHLSLVWIIVVSVIVGWMLGLGTGFLFRLRTRRRHPEGSKKK